MALVALENYRRMKPLGVLLLLLTSIPPIKNYSITYFDCDHITQLATYQLSEVCKPLKTALELPDTNNTIPMQVLQRGTAKRMKGFSCQVVGSKFTDYCGAYGHLKWVRMPEIGITRTISPATCSQIIATGKFTADDGSLHDVQLQAENVLHTTELGAIELADNSVSCRGQSLNVDGHVIDDIVVIGQYKITLIAEDYLVRGQSVEVSDGHLVLPTTVCALSKGGCTTHSKTYIWTPPSNKCDLELVRTINPIEENGFLVDRFNKVLLKRGSLTATGDGCPAGMVFATEYHDLFLAPTSLKMKFTPMGDDADITNFIKGRDNYILYETELNVQRQKHKLQSNLCSTQMEERGTELVRIKGNNYIRRNGDSIEHFVCERKRGTIKAAPTQCYDEIPLENGKFVKVTNQVLTSHASPRPCNPHYGLKIATLEGPWIELTPTVKQIQTPAMVPALAPGFKHEDLSVGGIYTSAELDSWREHIAYGDLHSAIVKTLTMGVCVRAGSC